MNYGFQDLDHSKQLVLESKDEFNRYFIQLYEFVASATVLKNMNVLEVGSGRGGGADYIKRYHAPSKMTGVDYSKNAVQFSSNTFETPNLYFQLGDAENLPFESEQFDAVVNVESSHCYANMVKFIDEVTRVLKPGGYLSFADFRDEEAFNELENHLSASGLTLIKKTNISAQVLHALDEFNDAKMERFSKMFGSWLKKPLSEFAGMKGSAMHTDLSNGSTLYCHFLLQKKSYGGPGK
jgi:ubiquinone/menaquinone biosynthesis C-methylase UbiE